MKKGNTLADLLPASTKKQLLDMKKNYKPVPKIDNKHSLANFELDRSERDHLIKKEIGTKDNPKLVYEYDKTKDRIVANPVEDPPCLVKENAKLRRNLHKTIDDKIDLKKRINRLEVILAAIIDLATIKLDKS